MELGAAVQTNCPDNFLNSTIGIVFDDLNDTINAVKDLWELEVHELNKLYQQESAKLQQRLLTGALWEEVTEERKRLGELSNVIYKKTNPAQFGHPAEASSRNKRNIKGKP